jgi:hypothetical protein
MDPRLGRDQFFDCKKIHCRVSLNPGKDLSRRLHGRAVTRCSGGLNILEKLYITIVSIAVIPIPMMFF